VWYLVAMEDGNADRQSAPEQPVLQSSGAENQSGFRQGRRQRRRRRYRFSKAAWWGSTGFWLAAATATFVVFGVLMFRQQGNTSKTWVFVGITAPMILSVWTAVLVLRRTSRAQTIQIDPQRQVVHFRNFVYHDRFVPKRHKLLTKPYQEIHGIERLPGGSKGPRVFRVLFDRGYVLVNESMGGYNELRFSFKEITRDTQAPASRRSVWHFYAIVAVIAVVTVPAAMWLATKLGWI